MLYFEKQDIINGLSEDELRAAIFNTLKKFEKISSALIIPPDFTRAHSFSGPLTRFAYQYLGRRLKAVLPALGTHSPMSKQQIQKMYAGVPLNLFRVHNWRTDVLTLGRVPADFVAQVSENKVHYDWPAQVNRLLVEGQFDLILSIGQVVPHEVAGMANHVKNIFVGTGGAEGINKSHFLGAVYGIENILGRVKNPVRQVLEYASDRYLKDLPIVYVLTVVGKNKKGQLVPLGLFIGDDLECFHRAAKLSLKTNFVVLENPLNKVIVYLKEDEFKSTWLGNKSIYRTRMAIADGGELIILAPGLKEFGEDPEIDRLIRKYGYKTTPEILRFTEQNKELQNNLSAAAHLIHGSSENRFKIVYCPGHLTEQEIRSVNYLYADLPTMLKRYDPQALHDGFNKLPNGEQVYFISNPALGLWAWEGSLKT